MDEYIKGQEVLQKNLANPENRQEALLNVWDNIFQRQQRGENVNEELLSLRISSVSEGDTREKRTKDAIRDFKVSQKYDEVIHESRQRGQTEEDFQQELSSFGSLHREAMRKAQASVK